MDLLIIIILSIIVLPLVAFTSGLLRIIIGIIFILFIPGYALISVLFPKKSSMRTLERFVLSVASSMAIVVFTGLLLNFTPFGIRLWPVIISLLVIIAVLLGIAWFRRCRLPADERFSLISEFNLFKYSWIQEWAHSKTKIIILLVLIFLASGFMTYIVINSRASLNEKIDEFYLLSQEGITQGYPRTVHPGESVTIKAVIVNHQSVPLDYSIKLLVNGSEIKTYQPIRVLKGEKSINDITFIPDTIGNNQKVEYWFYQIGKSEPESKLYIWIDVVK